MLGGSKKSHNNANTAGDESTSVDAFMLLDRFVSASTASDVLASLQGLEKGLKQDFANVSETILDYEDHLPLKHLWKLLHREHDKLQDDDDQAAEGVLEACRILTHFLTKHSTTSNTASYISNTQQALLAKRLLGEPAPGRILEALLDVVVAQDDAINNQGHVNEDGETLPPTTATAPLTPYVRVLACQALHKLCTLQPQLAQPQLLRAPNGLHRLVGLLGPEIDEQVRNETLLLAATLAQWPAVAQVWIFAGLPDTLLELATQGEDSGLTRGPVLTQDALAIFDNLVTHIANPNMAELLLTGNSSQPQPLGQRMCQLLDLRQGQYFIHPETNQTIPTKVSKDTKKAANDEDDLDDLIKSASSNKKKTPSQNMEEEAKEPVVIPRLLASEEVILKTILSIWSTLLHDQPKVQEIAWKQHGMVIRMIWEMALLSPPPTPYTPYPCGVPSVALQQAALHAVAESMVFCFDDIVGARDRLLYMVCTGGLGQTLEDKYAISQAALYVLRQAAPRVLTTEMILFALSPPPTADENTAYASEQPAPPENAMVVPKLLSTIQQHLVIPSPENISQSGSETDAVLQTVGLVGSVGALSLFLKDDVSRSMLLKLVVHQQESNIDIPADGPTFIDNLLDRIEYEMDQEELNVGIITCLLRFLATWCSKAPEVVYAVFQSTKATILSTILSNSKKQKSVGQAAGLVLGICLADLRDESKASGWTRDTLVQLLSRRQQSFQQKSVDMDGVTGMPWSYSEFELKVYKEWKRSTLLTVRQAVVQFLTSGSEQGDDEDEDGDDSHHDDKSTTSSGKALSKVMAQQTAELESLRQELATANKEIEEKNKQLSIYKMRVECTPTELDKLVEETTEDNQKLKREMDQIQQTAHAAEIEMASVQENLKAAQDERDDALQEVATLRQDMESLTQAFSSMESELNRQQEEVKRLQQGAQHQYQSDQQTSASEPTSESGDTSSTQVATLRAENARFREDAKAKDNWMQMAVERFKVLDQEKVSMQQQIQSLSESSNSADVVEKLQKDHIATLEALERDHTSQVNQLQSQMQQELVAKENLQKEVESLKHEIEVIKYAADGAKKESDQRLADLQQRLEASTPDESSKNSESFLAQEELSKLKEDTEKMLIAKDEKIRDLESRVQHQDDKSKESYGEDIRGKDEEIAQLRQSNDAAQEWMSKAVEHHNLLSEQVATLTAERERLQNDLADLSTRLLPLETSAKLYEEVQKELDNKTAEMKELSAMQNSKLEEMQVSHQQSQKMMQSQIETLSKELDDRRSELSATTSDGDELMRVKADLAAKIEQINGLLEEHDALKLANERLFDLDMEVVELRAELKDALEEKEALKEELKMNKPSSLESMEELTTRIKMLEDENANLVRALKVSSGERDAEMNEIEGRWKVRYDTVQAQNNELEEMLKVIKEAQSNTSNPQSSGESRSENQSDAVNELKAQIETLREEMDAQEREAASVIAQWQESYTSIQTQYTELQQRRSDTGDDMSKAGYPDTRIMELEKALEEKDQEANDVISQWQSQYAELQRRLDELQEGKSVSGDTQKVSDLQKALEDKEREANNVIAQWQESYANLQKDNSDLLSRLETSTTNGSSSEMQQKTTALEQELAEYKATSGGFWEEIDSLKSQVKKLEDELEKAKQSLSNKDSQLQKVVAEKEAAESQLSTMSNEYNDILSKEDEQDRKMGALQQKIADLESKMLASEAAVDESAARVTELEAQLALKEEDLMADEKEADEVIQQWQESHEELSKENASLNERIETLTAQYEGSCAENERLASQVTALESTLGVVEEEKVQLQALQNRVSELQSLLDSKDVEIKKVASENERFGDLQRDLHDARTHLEDLNRKLEDAQFKSQEDAATIEQLEDALEQGRSGSEELEAVKAKLLALEQDLRDTEEQFAADSEEADEVINQWKESYENLEAEKSELEVRLSELEETLAAAEGSRNEYAGIAEQLQSDLDSMRNSANAKEASQLEEVNVLREQIQRLENDLIEKDKSVSEQVETMNRAEELQQELAAANYNIAEMNIQIQGLKDNVIAKEAQLVEETENADEVIAEWEASHTALQEEKAEADIQMAALKASLESFEAERKALNDQLSALDLSSKSQVKTFAEKEAVLLSEIADLKKQLESQILDDERSLAEASTLSESLEVQIRSLLQQVHQLRGEVEKASNERDDLQGQFSTAQTELSELRAKTKDQEESLEKFEDLKVQFESLCEERDELKNRLTHLGSAAQEKDDLIARCENAEAISTKLTHDLEKVRIEASELQKELRKQISQLEEQLKVSNSSIDSYNSRISDLENELSAEIQQADEAIQEWQSSYQALQEEKEALETQLSSTSEQPLTGQVVPPPPPPNENSESASSLESQLRDAKAASEELNREYLTLMNSFESTVNLYDELEAKYNELEQKYLDASKEIAEKDSMLNDLRTNNDTNERAHIQQDNRFIPISESDTLSPPPASVVSNIQAELEAEREARKKEEERCKELEVRIDTQKAESDRLIKSWKGEAEEMGKLLMKTNAELENNRRQSETAIDSLKARFTEMEEKELPRGSGGEDTPDVAQKSEPKVSRKKFEKEIANRKAAEDKATLAEQRLVESEKEAIAAKKKLQETEEALTSRLESAISEQEREKIDREAQRTLENDRFMNLEREFESLRRDHAALERDRDSLKASLVELEADLQDANHELQLHLTNEISEQATKLAAEALRRQVDEMRQQAEVDTSTFNAERTARLAAEQEAKRLQADLAALLGLENTERNQNEIRRRTAEATDYFQRTEKKEIQELSSALGDFKEKLQAAQFQLKAAEERADSASLQSNQLEQDLSVAKSDLKILSHMIEEMREAESSRRASMEHRISGLEDEKTVMQRHYKAEIENMRTELEQISLQRDRLAQALKESDKSKDALLQASKSGRGMSSENPSDELVRLRMEKAHLLAAASQEASRTERRIRELREAAMSSADADLLVERELRAAAELALANATSELQSARVNSNATDSQGQSRIHELEAEVKKLYSQMPAIISDNKELSDKITEIQHTSKQTIDRLKEECRLAKAKALQSERAGRHDAEFRAEVARLQDSSSVDGHTSVDDSSTFGEFKHDTQISNLYDLVDQQRQTIEEQRDAHSSMEADFEGLLALLAQSKLVEECLSSSLARSCGEKAVRDAIIDAEERAVAQYGTFVRVSE